MHGRVAGRDDLAADVVEPVDGFVDRALVPGDGRGAEDDGVAASQLDLRVVAIGHPAQRGQGLALRAGRDDDDALVGEVLELAQADQLPVVDVDVPERASDADVLAHRASDESDLAIERGGGVERLLHAVDVRGEARDHDPAHAAGEHVLQRWTHQRLRW